MARPKATTNEVNNEEELITLEEAPKIEYKNFLSKKIVRVQPLDIKISPNQQYEQLPEGFLMPNAQRTFPLRRDNVTGGFVEIFDRFNKFAVKGHDDPMSELEFMSMMVGEDLDFHKSTFWSGKMDRENPSNNRTPYVAVVPASGRVLDLSNPKDYIDYKILSTWFDKYISPSWQERNARPSYVFALVDEKVDVDVKKEKINLKLKAMSEFNKIKDSSVLLKEVLLLDNPRNVFGDNVSHEYLFNLVYTMVEETPQRFLNALSDPEKEMKLLIHKAVKAGAIKKSGDKYYTMAEEPLGLLGELIAVLKDPEKIQFREKIEFQVDNYKSSL